MWSASDSRTPTIPSSVKDTLFSDLHWPAGHWSSANTTGTLPRVCVQQFLHENGPQLCLYLVCRFVLGWGYGTRKSFCQNAVSKSWLHANSKVFSLVWNCWPQAQIMRGQWAYILSQNHISKEEVCLIHEYCRFFWDTKGEITILSSFDEY